MSFVPALMNLFGALGSADTATDSSQSTPDRAVAGASGAATILSTLGAGTSAAELAAMTGTTALGLGSAAAASGAVLGAGVAGYGAGSAIDKMAGRWMGGQETHHSRGVGGGPDTHTPDQRRLSERIADASHTQMGDRAALSIAPYLPVWLGGG